MIKNLEDIPLFHNLDKDALGKISSIVSEVKFRKGEEVFKEGSPGDAFFIIKNGEIEIRKLIDVDEKRYKTLVRLAGGDFFGEMALFEEKPRSASAYCPKDTVLFKINGDDFQKLLQEDIKVASKLLSTLVSAMSGRLRQTTRELVTLYETGKIIGEKQGIIDLSKKILKQILFAIPEADAGLLATFNEFTDEYEIISYEGYEIKDDDKIIEKNEPLISDVAEKGEAILIHDVEEYKKLKNIKEDKFYFGMSLLASLMMVHNKILGVAILTNKKEKNAFTSDNANLLFSVTSQIASAIQNAKYQREEEDRKRLERVFIR